MSSQNGVMIAGIGCRLSGIRGPAELWQHLLSPVRRCVPLPAERWHPDWHSADLEASLLETIQKGALLHDFSVDFRAMRIPPIQLERMHRLDVLAVGTMCEALTDAGVQPSPTPLEDVQVIVAAQTLGPDPVTDTVRRIRRFEMQGPVSHALAGLPASERADIDTFVEQLFNLAAPPMEVDSLLTSASIIAGRLANIYNFRGGHHVVDCGAASSIAALEQGLDLITSGEARIVVVSGFAPMLTPSSLLRHAACGLLGEPQPFDASSQGLILGEGCITIVLMRADDASGYAMLHQVETVGCAASRDAGQVKASLDAAIKRTLAKQNTKIRFVASRASGVPALDAAEHEALEQLGQPSLSSQAAYFGHLQAASGLVACAEAALAAKHGRWPQSGDTVGQDETLAFTDAGLGSVAGFAIVGPARSGSARIETSRVVDDAIAIVGAGALAPRAANCSEFWANILANVEAIGDLPASRFDAEQLIGSGTEAASMLKTRLAGITDVPAVDWTKLGWSKEAIDALDPSVAYALAVAAEALGPHDTTRYAAERVDVIFGQLPLRANESLLESRVLFAHHLNLVRDALTELGIEEKRARAILAAAREHFERSSRRFDLAAYDAFSGSTCSMAVAKAFGFRGLVASVDAACASSLVSLKNGIDRLLSGRSDLVLAGGVAYNILPEFYIALSMLGFLSTDAAPPFSKGSNGFVPAEGAGCVVLKRRADALRDGDRILAVVRGIGCSSDGRGQAVLAPNTEGQQLAINRALRMAQLAPAEIDVLEAHGAGTAIGDDVEMKSYAATYGNEPRATPLAIGALKSQIGHTSSASGILGVIKAAMALETQIIPPSNLDDESRANLPFGRMGFEVATTRREWFVIPGKRRYAGVTSIGMGGVNYHVILERHEAVAQAHAAPPTLPPRGTYASRFLIDSVPLPLAQTGQRSLSGCHVAVLGTMPPIVEALESRGAVVTVCPQTQGASWIEEARRKHGRFTGLVDLSAFRDDLQAPLPVFVRALNDDNQAFFAVARALYDDLLEPDAFFYAVTALGGDFGLLGGGGGSPFGASRQGFLRALKQEVASLDAKALDFPWDVDPHVIAQAVLAELDDRNDRSDVAYRSGRRFVAQFSRKSFKENETVLRSFGPSDVVLFTGGGRGVTYVCAKALAARGARVILCGRTEPAPREAPWLAMDDEAFANFKQSELISRKKANPALTPAAFQREFSTFAAQRELHKNLLEAEALKLDLHYLSCDVSDFDAVKTLTASIRAKHGPLTGVVHGAMVETSRSLPGKTDAIIEATFATKAKALLYLWEATRSDPLRTFMCFGSGAARFGNRGQSDYAAANALMAHLLASLAKDDARQLHHVTLDWTAWDGVGAAVADPALAALVRATGVSSIRPQEGEYWFMAELMHGRAGEALIFDERLLHDWPFIGSRADGVSQRRRFCDGFGTLLVPGEFPLLDTLDVENSTAFWRLDGKRDSFIAQHRLYETPILPATFGAELLAEAATAMNPGFVLQRLDDYVIHTPSKLHRGEPLDLQIVVRIQNETASTRTLHAESRSKLVVKGRTLQELRLHHTARIVMSKDPNTVQTRPIIEPEGVAHARSFFHLAKEPVGLGPVFSRAAWIKVLAQNAFGRIRAPRMRDLFAHTTHPRFQIDPLMMDAAFQIAANWDGLLNDYVSIPFSVQSIYAGRLRGISEEAKVIATAVKVQDPDVFYDIVIVGERDEVLLDVRGLLLRRIAKLSANDNRGVS